MEHGKGASALEVLDGCVGEVLAGEEDLQVGTEAALEGKALRGIAAVIVGHHLEVPVRWRIGLEAQGIVQHDVVVLDPENRSGIGGIRFVESLVGDGNQRIIAVIAQLDRLPGLERQGVDALHEIDAGEGDKSFHVAGRKRHVSVVERKRGVAPGLAQLAAVVDQGFAVGEEDEAAFAPVIAIATGALLEQEVEFVGLADFAAKHGAEAFQAAAGQGRCRGGAEIVFG